MSGFLDTLQKVVSTVSSALAGPVVPAMIEIGKEVLELVNQTAEVVGTDDAEKLQLMRDELEPLVMAHAAATEKALRGQPE